MTVSKTQLATAGRKVRESTERRNELIRQAHAENMPAPAIGMAVGLSRPGVYKIIRANGNKVDSGARSE